MADGGIIGNGENDRLIELESPDNQRTYHLIKLGDREDGAREVYIASCPSSGLVGKRILIRQQDYLDIITRFETSKDLVESLKRDPDLGCPPRKIPKEDWKNIRPYKPERLVNMYEDHLDDE